MGGKMDRLTSYCGLVCETCLIYLAAREKDGDKRYDMRARIAREIKKLYGEEYKPENISDCDGCKAESGRLFSGCKDCRIRNCAKRKGVENCAYCAEYACEKLDDIFATEPAAKARLDALRDKL